MGKIAFLFAGQGSQYVGMGMDLYQSEETVKAVFDMGEKMRAGTIEQCFYQSQEILTQTQNAQPCLFLMDFACAKALESYGIEPDMTAGFSLGEIAAIAFCGVLTAKEAFSLVTLRGSKMAECAKLHPGAMAAVLRLSAKQVEALCSEFEGVFPVNYNCPGQIVVSGASEKIKEFSNAVKKAGGRTLLLKVNGAFHTPYMEEASVELRNYLKQLNVKKSDIPLLSNITGQFYCDEAGQISELIARQASSSVQWEKTLRNMFECGVDTFIEVGAGKTLSGFVMKTLTDVKVMNVCDINSLHNVVNELSERKTYA